MLSSWSWSWSWSMVMALEDMSSSSPQCWDWSGCHQQTFGVEGKWGIIKVRLFKSCRANSDWLHSLNPPPPRSKTTMENQNERISSLRLKVRDKLFSKSGDLKIKCTAAIDTIYWRSNEESIQGLSERSYNLNIRDNGWNSGVYPEKSFSSPKKENGTKFYVSVFSVSAAIPIRSSSPSVSLFPALLGWALLSTRFNIFPIAKILHPQKLTWSAKIENTVVFYYIS